MDPVDVQTQPSGNQGNSSPRVITHGDTQTHSSDNEVAGLNGVGVPNVMKRGNRNRQYYVMNQVFDF